MTALLSIGEIRAQIQSNQTDDALLAIAAREQAVIERYYGDPTAERVELLRGNNKRYLQLRRPISSINTIYESFVDASDHTTATLLTAGSQYRIWKPEGMIEKRMSGYAFLPEYQGGIAPYWLPEVEITWTPIDDTYERKAVLIDLIRLAISKTVMKMEMVGEYRYQAPEDWEMERQKLIKRLSPIGPRL